MLGRGACGEVRLGFRIPDLKRVAIKIINKRTCSTINSMSNSNEEVMKGEVKGEVKGEDSAVSESSKHHQSLGSHQYQGFSLHNSWVGGRRRIVRQDYRQK